MASAAADEAHNSDIDDPASRHSPRRNGKAVRPRVHTNSHGAPSPPRPKPAMDDQQDDASISPESDNDRPDRSPAPLQRPQGMSPQSPVRQKPPVANPPVGHRDQYVPPSPSRSRPASLTGPPPPDDGRRHSAAMSNGRYRHHERTNGRPTSQGHPPYSPSGPWPKTRGSSSSTVKPSHPQSSRRSHHMSGDPRQRAPSPPTDLLTDGRQQQINRLESPSIAKSVLHPLEHKITEYEKLMKEAQEQTAQLDEELRQLQERRQQTEDRFYEAKAKHDDYERQRQDVDRALRGELDAVVMQQHQQPPPQAMASYQQQGMQSEATMQPMVSFERRPTSNPASKQSSRARKLGTRDRIKMSLFGSI